MNTNSAGRFSRTTFTASRLFLALALCGLGAGAADARSYSHAGASSNHVGTKSGYVGAGPSGGGYVRVAHTGGGHYYPRGGYWNRHWGTRYWVGAPLLSLGLVVPFLPWGYTTVWYGGAPYYYYDNVYYVGHPDGGYVVTTPPAAVRVDAPENPAERIFAYPKNGQTATQTTFDKIECERSATEQTGYNPAQSVFDAVRRDGYRQAVIACLGSRGYTAK